MRKDTWFGNEDARDVVTRAVWGVQYVGAWGLSRTVAELWKMGVCFRWVACAKGTVVCFHCLHELQLKCLWYIVPILRYSAMFWYRVTIDGGANTAFLCCLKDVIRYFLYQALCYSR